MEKQVKHFGFYPKYNEKPLKVFVKGNKTK